MPETTFHQLCRAGFASRMSRTGETEDDLAEAMQEIYGSTITGDELRMMHVTGYSTHVLDMVAGTVGKSALTMIAVAMQMFTDGPHALCPSCTCGIVESEREEIAAAFLRGGMEEGRAALLAVRASLGQVQAGDCNVCELVTP